MHRKSVRTSWLTATCLLAVTALTAYAAPKNKPSAASAKPAEGAVRVVPDFTWIGAGGKVYPGKNFRGQPVVILIASSPDAGDLRKQAGRIEDRYLDFAAKKTIFVAAYTGTMGRVQSDVPFVVAQNGAAVAANFGVQAGNGLGIVVLAPDGHVDMTSTHVEGAQRLLDIISNTFQTQAAERTGLGG